MNRSLNLLTLHTTGDSSGTRGPSQAIVEGGNRTWYKTMGGQVIPLFAPSRQNEGLLPEIQTAIAAVIHSGEYILGREVEQFEKNLGHSLGYHHAVGCSSGTDALVLALRALELSPGDEIITPAFSFIASTSAIVWAGLTPVLTDVSLETGCLTIEYIEKVLTPKTRAVMAVDLYGRQPDIEQLRRFCDKRGLSLIEDGAQSIGVPKQGAHLYTTSFYPTKNLGALGDAGAVLTDDPILAQKVRELSRHGSLVRDHYPRVGTTARLDTLQAAVLNLKLQYLTRWTEQRREMAEFYLEGLSAVCEKVVLPPLPKVQDEHVWSLFTLRLPRQRGSAIEFLRSKGIGCGVYYSQALSRQPALRGYVSNPCPNSEKLAEEVLSIPLYPELTRSELQAVVNACVECFQTILT